MPRDARITDLCTHGPMIITGAAQAIDENQPMSRIGDIYACPVHGPNPIVTGADHMVIEGSPNSRIGDVTACGAVICTGAVLCDIG